MSEAITIPGKNGGTLKPWAKGQSGNPLGRKTLGRYVTDWMNKLAGKGYNEDKLKRIAKNKYCDGNMRLAAKRILRMMEDPDMADYEPLLDGQKCMKELRHDGVDTRLIKKVKVKRREIPQKDDVPVIEVEREVELHDRSGDEFDRVLDRTDGKPAQTVQGPDGGGIPLDVTIMKVTFDT